jgi:sugar transferase (PEP-CTERM/EpsH1 system associated)
MTSAPDSRPLIAHVLFRFDIGGLENGVVNLINHLPEQKWRHAVIALDDISPMFRSRVERSDVLFHALRKPPGHLLGQYPRLVRLFRSLRPAIVHTRNLAALEATVPAWLAGVSARVHGEHGWDVHDLDGRSGRFARVRRLYRPFVKHYIALSDQMATYLEGRVGIDPGRVTRIYNGVDMARFRSVGSEPQRGALPFKGSDLFVVGAVGRMQPVKDHLSLIRGFALLAGRSADAGRRLRLVIVGDGPVRSEAERAVREAGLTDHVWLAGAQENVPELLQTFDMFVQPSLSEGISNTILEAMSTSLPVVATRVGGNAELVDDGITGTLVPAGEPAAIADALGKYFLNPAVAAEHGAAGRRRVEERFSIQSMAAAYEAVYERMLPSHLHLEKGAAIGA